MTLVSAIRRHTTGRSLFGGYGRALALLLAFGYVAAPAWPQWGGTPDGSPALPRTVYVPESGSGQAPGTQIGEIDVDRASVVVRGYADDVVLVDAVSGRSHLVSLPDMHTFDGESPLASFALSHDGRRLAWAYAAYDTDEAGLAVMELGDDGIERLPLTGRKDLPVRIDQISWSADGSHLAWYGDEASAWRDASSSFMGPVRTFGVTATDELSATFSSASGRYEKYGNFTGTGVVAVDDSGRARALMGDRLLSFGGGPDEQTPATRVVSERAHEWSSASISADGSTLAVGINGDQIGDGMSTGLRTLDLTDEASQLTLHPWQGARDGDRVDVLGFSPDELPVVVHSPQQPRDGMPEVRLLSSGPGQVISTLIDTWAGDVITVATDLADRTPLEVAAPRWPVSQTRWIVIGLTGTMLAIELLSLLARRRRGVPSGAVAGSAGADHVQH